MRREFVLASAFGSVAVLGVALAVSGLRGAEIKSGLAPGDAPPAFMVQDATGPAVGEGKLCYRCRYGGNPVVAVFTRKLDAHVTALVKKVDEQVAKNSDKRMKAFVVYLTNDPDKAENKLKALADKNDITHVPLTIFDGPSGPPAYKLSDNAEVTVLMWVKSDVKVNHAFADGQLDKHAIDGIIKDTSKILD
jgi:hypothetical protein